MAGEHERAYALEPGDRVGLLEDGLDSGRRGIVRAVGSSGVATVDMEDRDAAVTVWGMIAGFFRIGEDGPDDGGAA